MSVSDEKYYGFVTRQIEYTNEKIIQAFELFIKLFVAIAGGTIWLKSQYLDNCFSRILIIPVRFLLIIISLGSIAVIILNLRSWWGYRKAQVRLREDVPLPKHPWSYLHEIILITIILLVMFFGCTYVGKVLNFK